MIKWFMDAVRRARKYFYALIVVLFVGAASGCTRSQCGAKPGRSSSNRPGSTGPDGCTAGRRIPECGQLGLQRDLPGRRWYRSGRYRFDVAERPQLAAVCPDGRWPYLHFGHSSAD